LNKLRSKLAGRAHAVANGVRLGRKPKLPHHRSRKQLSASTTVIARSYNVSRWATSRLKG
jgi:hypothetical protein